MLNIITSLLDALFPPRDSELIVRTVTVPKLLSLYRPGTHLRIEYLSNFQNPKVHALITENKYYGNRRATNLLAKLITLHLKGVDCVLIPIPLHPKRERERGYNQVTVVLQQSGLRVEDKLIKRIKYTTSQTTLQKNERLENIKGAFSVDTTKLMSYQNTHFILIDDVVTSGATLAAARAKLAPHLHPTSRLTCLALAH